MAESGERKAALEMVRAAGLGGGGERVLGAARPSCSNPAPRAGQDP